MDNWVIIVISFGGQVVFWLIVLYIIICMCQRQKKDSGRSEDPESGGIDGSELHFYPAQEDDFI